MVVEGNLANASTSTVDLLNSIAPTDNLTNSPEPLARCRGCGAKDYTVIVTGVPRLPDDPLLNNEQAAR